RIDILLDTATRSANGNGVIRGAEALDEMLLDHQRGLATHLQVVMGVGTGARRVNDRVAFAQHFRRQGPTADSPLRMANGDATFEVEQQTPVPFVRCCGIGGIPQRSEGSETVEEAVDGAALLADDEIHYPTIGERGGGHISGARTIRWQGSI